MNRSLLFCIFMVLIVVLTGCANFRAHEPVAQIKDGDASSDPFKRGSNIPGKFYWAGRADEKKVALTFDDGPDLYWTPRILDILKAKGVKATFFVIGRMVQKHPDMLKRIDREGHIVGNHTFDHADLVKLRPQIIKQEIDKCNDIVWKTIGKRPILLRPPFGFHNAAVDKLIYAKQMVVVLWSTDTEDWQGLDAGTVKRRILDHVGNGFITLQHDGENPHLAGSVEALGAIIDGLRAQGYELVTVPELLNTAAYELVDGNKASN